MIKPSSFEFLKNVNFFMSFPGQMNDSDFSKLDIFGMFINDPVQKEVILLL